MNKKIIVTIISIVVAAFGYFERGPILSGFTTNRGFTTLTTDSRSQITYSFGVFNIPLERPGAASSSTGYEFGKIQVNNVAGASAASTSFTMSSTSAGFAVTMGEAGSIKGCTFNLNAVPTTGTVGIMIQKNGTLQSGVYCKLPASGTFATNAILSATSTNQSIDPATITFVAGDRIGLIASSSNLNAATIDGISNLLIQLNN